MIAAQLAAPASAFNYDHMHLSPIALDLGVVQIRWYALSYIAMIVLGWWYLGKLLGRSGAPMAKRHVDDLVFYVTLGIIVGGRIGYSLFYQPELWAHPTELLKLWNGGMSFHGGLIGTVLAIAWVSWRGKLEFLRVTDYIAVCVPFGLFFGRLANFVNGELWGRITEGVPWAMVFPDGGPLPRHPSQLYEAGLEGLVLMVILLTLFWKTRARWRPGLLVGLFTLGYGLARFTVEYFREPDQQLQEFAARTGFSMGQWLTVPMIAVGLFFFVRALTRRPLGADVAVPA